MHGENGENGINHMNLDELQTLENNLEMWVNNIRSQKVRFIRFLVHTDEIFSKKKNSILMYCSHMLNRCRSSLGSLRCSGTRLVQYFRSVPATNSGLAISVTNGSLRFCFAGSHAAGRQWRASGKGIANLHVLSFNIYKD
jgi:hypothetical protein